MQITGTSSDGQLDEAPMPSANDAKSTISLRYRLDQARSRRVSGHTSPKASAVRAEM